MSLPALDDSLPAVPPLRKATPPLTKPTQPNSSQVPVVTPPDDTMEVDTTPAASQDLEDDVSDYPHPNSALSSFFPFITINLTINPTLPYDSSISRST